MLLRKINFGAGPAKIPPEVLLETCDGMINYKGTGIGILEMSHRSKEFADLLEETKSLLRQLMNIPDEFEILFMQGGGSGQFAAVPMNLKGTHEFADYIITGAWSSKAAQEGSKYIRVKRVFTPNKPYVTIPDEEQWDHDKEAAFLYYCANETVHGIEFPTSPHSVHGVPLVADISSNFLSRPFDFTNHGVVFGGAQKNLGAAGLTIVMVRKDLIGKLSSVLHLPITPAILCYKEMKDNNSLYNTPAVYGVYVTNLVLKWMRDRGGVEAISEMNKNKAKMLYDLIDSSNDFYKCEVDKKCRSTMNVCFRIMNGDEQLEAEFLKGAVDRGMISLRGHRSVGGIRASLYNAITTEETAFLAKWMREFMDSHTS
ncbi:phosphoserine transaminase [Dictyocaulus viviparus]|uniref:Phosphoserine aminotransferase n=1 Tax=Dictyocaulus viviparus TaxID=29172 RepID=A0A0D8Y7Y0_DICVI|nr:phosphoserine transaminase [Dictyocaulus viviparus]